MMNFHKLFSTRQTPQSEAIPASTQRLNNSGGFAWKVDDWTRLDRFLILGSEGGTYYVKPRGLTIANAEAVTRCIDSDGLRVVKRVVDISQAGRGPKNDPALFVLAMCAGLGNEDTRRAALTALPQVARIGTHLFHFMAYVEGFRGWGRGMRRAVGSWYTDMAIEKLAYQVVKYRQRDGWSHRDVLRLAHPKPVTESHGQLFRWITQGEIPTDESLGIVQAMEQAKQAESEATIRQLVETHRLPWEAIPSLWLDEQGVWESLLPNLPLTATLRNLGRLTANGVLAPMNKASKLVVQKITNPEALQRARVHPLAVLVALKTYQSGGGHRSSLKWKPVTKIVDALDKAYYQAFDTIKPTNQRIMLALDVSASMGSPVIAGLPSITPRVGAAAMAMVTARTEPDYMVTTFSSGGKHSLKAKSGYYSTAISTFDISPRERLDDIIDKTSRLPFGGTDCALPMLYALKRKLKIDAFIIYTDSETWAGDIHPAQALRQYREKTGIPAKLIVVGMVSNGFSIADPEDMGMMDVVGFDVATPNVMADFIENQK